MGLCELDYNLFVRMGFLYGAACKSWHLILTTEER